MEEKRDTSERDASEYDIFISYSRKDYEEVDALRRRMIDAVPDLKVWFDLDGIESGEEFQNVIVRAIKRSKWLVFAVSRNSLESRYAHKEVSFANKKGKKIIPLLLKGGEIDDWFLFEFCDIDQIDSCDKLQMGRLLRDLSGLVEKRKRLAAESASATPSGDAEDAFDLSDAADVAAVIDDWREGMPIFPENVERVLRQALRQLERREYTMGVRYLENAADSGHPYALYRLAMVYMGGEGVSRDSAKAAELFAKAAELGYAPASYNLGVMYMKGNGVTRDYAKARRCYEAAAAKQYAPAQYNLAYMYFNGMGVGTDMRRALELYKVSAGNDFVPAIYSLACMHYCGYAGESDKPMGIRLFEKAASRGSDAARQVLEKLTR